MGWDSCFCRKTDYHYYKKPNQAKLSANTVFTDKSCAHDWRVFSTALPQWRIELLSNMLANLGWLCFTIIRYLVYAHCCVVRSSWDYLSGLHVPRGTIFSGVRFSQGYVFLRCRFLGEAQVQLLVFGTRQILVTPSTPWQKAKIPNYSSIGSTVTLNTRVE